MPALLASPCGVPKLASHLQIADFSECAPNFGTPQGGITADEAALALSATKGLAGPKTRDLAARTLRRLATTYGLRAVVQSLR